MYHAKDYFIYQPLQCNAAPIVEVAPGDINRLNDQQQAAVDFPGSALILAGAGTGKTRVIVARVQSLLARNVPPREILAVTYTKKAASEMRDRLGQAGAGVIISTFHSLGARFLRAHADVAGLPPKFQILDTIGQTAMIKRILQDDMGLPKPTADVLNPKDICAVIAKLKEKGIRFANLAKSGKPNDKVVMIAHKVYRIYEQKLKNEGKVDFADLLLNMLELLRDHRDIRAQWQQRFSHILIDELQDINKVQMEIVGYLKDGDRTVMFGVGDDDQSIYGFRGASPQHVRDFAKWHAANKVLRLEKNYRSTENILALANAVIRGNDGRLGKTLTGVAGTGSRPILERYKTDDKEAYAVARHIVRQRSAGIPAEQIAVLYRNNALSQLLETALNDSGILFSIRGGTRFFAREEVKDIIAYLQVAASPQNLQALLRSVNKPPRKVGTKVLEQLSQAGTNAWDMVVASDHPGLCDYRQIIEKIQVAIAQDDLQGATETAVSNSGLQDYLIGKNMHEKAGNLDELISAAARFAENKNGSIDEFIAQVTLDPELDDDEARVSLMTIHSAKGLEFDCVFLIGLEQGILPGRNFDGINKLESERRLLYVAVTRARRELRMSHVDKRRQRGVLNDMWRSSLLDDIPKKLFDHYGGLRPASADSDSYPAIDNYQSDKRVAPNFARVQHVSSSGGFIVGQKVVHNKFGPGVIVALEGSGDKAKAQVTFFKDRETRLLMLKVANLKEMRPVV